MISSEKLILPISWFSTRELRGLSRSQRRETGGEKSRTNLEVLQAFGHDVRPHLVPLDHVSSELGVTTHGASAVSLVEALVHILGRETQMLELEHLEDG